MGNGFEMGVVIGMSACTQSVDERRTQQIQALASAKDRRLGRSGKFRNGRQRRVDGRVPTAA